MRKTKKEIELEERICAEDKRLRAVYAGIEAKKMCVVDGLIAQAAFMRISLEDFNIDLNRKGFVEKFSQSKEQEPYERKRPVADTYNSMNANYQKIIKQLNDLLPKEEAKPEDDGFDDFCADRED